MGVTMIIFVVVTAFFTIRGYMNGFLASLARTVSIIGGYIAAFLLAKPASQLATKHLPIDGVLAYLAGGTAEFFSVLILIRVIFWLSQLKQEEEEEEVLSSKSRMGGAIIGVFVGAFIGIILVYLWSIYADAKQRDTAIEVTEPQINHIAKIVISKTAGNILAVTNNNDSTVKMSEAFLAAPVQSVDRISRITNNPDLQELLNDRRTQHLMKQGDVGELMKIPAFNRLMDNDDMRKLMADSGFNINNDDQIRATAKKLTAGYQAFHLMKDDPRVQNIITDPEFQQQLQATNKLPLLFNPNLNVLADIIFIEGSENASLMSDEKQLSTTIDYVDEGGVVKHKNDGSTQVYRSKTKDGKTIYSDRPIN